MQYPNNDLWTVRSIDLLEGALEDMANKTATYYPNKEYRLTIPGVAEYRFEGVLNFEGHDRTIMFEQGDGFGVTYDEIVSYLKKFNITFNELSE
jgi:hypothetical protein